ncbi:MAG: ATP-binding protein [Clostridia bacterium]|nr:ATP-binding protein [Clostridia bacterium]
MEELEKRWNSGRFEFGVVYGSRRIGKSVLLNEFISQRNGFRFQARKGTEEENLRAFSREFNRFRGIDENLRFDNFEHALEAVVAYAKKERFVFVIDEIAYFCVRSKSFLSTLQYFVDGEFQEANMMFILSGSNISFMKELLNNRNDPLYKRATFEMNVLKLPFSEALQFVRECTTEDKVAYLSLFGTYPYYLAMIDLSQGFETNVKNLLFSAYGSLVDAPDKVLPEGTSDQNTYSTILRAISLGKRSSKEISDYVGQSSGYLAAYLSAMVDMQILDHREAFTRNKKLNYYEISDNLLRFWYRFTYEGEDQITLGLGEILYQAQQKAIRTFLDHGFESLIIDYMTEQNVLGKLPHYYDAIRNYRVENSQLGRSIELDGLAESIDDGRKSLLIIEDKYRNRTFQDRDFTHLEESVSVFPGYRRIDYYLFSRGGYSPEMIALAAQRDNVHMLMLQDVMGEA